MKKAIIVLAVLTACGGGSGWSDAERQDFIDGCEAGGQNTENCTCMQEKLEDAHPELQDPADLDQDEVIEIAKECVG
jgi:hypothetical protein